MRSWRAVLTSRNRARHPLRGELQGLHPHHAAAPRQPRKFAFNLFHLPQPTNSHSQTLWTSSEAEPSGEAAAAPAEAQAETKDTADAPTGTEDKPAQ